MLVKLLFVQYLIEENDRNVVDGPNSDIRKAVPSV